ncbi:MAG: hypothetical protein QM770_17475 [Tepidisphaeraceae bacterium]
MNQRSAKILAAIALLSVSAHAYADRILEANADASNAGATLDNVRIKGVVPAQADQPARLTFNYQGGDTARPLTKIWALQLDDDKTLTDADAAYRSGKPDVAVDGYQRVARGGEEWKVRYVTPRLLDAATKANRFDAAVGAYLAYVRLDAAGAQSFKPALPAKGGKLLDDAVTQTDTALRSATDDAQRRAYLTFLLDLHTGRNDDANRLKVLEQLEKLLGNLGDDPASQGMLADIRLSQARSRLAERKFAEAQALIDQNADRFTEPRQQASALFVLAEAKAGTAKPGDKQAQQDAVLAYLKVVAHFRNADGRPMVGESLLKAAAIEAAIGDAATAESLYQSVVTDFPDTPFASDAQKALAQLKK